MSLSIPSGFRPSCNNKLLSGGSEGRRPWRGRGISGHRRRRCHAPGMEASAASAPASPPPAHCSSRLACWHWHPGNVSPSPKMCVRKENQFPDLRKEILSYQGAGAGPWPWSRFPHQFGGQRAKCSGFPVPPRVLGPHTARIFSLSLGVITPPFPSW